MLRDEKETRTDNRVSKPVSSLRNNKVNADKRANRDKKVSKVKMAGKVSGANKEMVNNKMASNRMANNKAAHKTAGNPLVIAIGWDPISWDRSVVTAGAIIVNSLLRFVKDCVRPRI